MLLDSLSSGGLRTYLLGIVFLDLYLWRSFLHYGRVFLGGNSVLLCLGSIGFRVTTRIGYLLVKLLQIGEYILGIIGLPELQVSTTLQEFAHTLRLADTRHLHHDTTCLSLQFLDVGLHHAKLIDTGAYHVERVVYGRLHFRTQCLLHFNVRALGRNLALQLLRSEYLRQLMAGSVLMVSVYEMGDEVASLSLFLCPGFSHGLGETYIGLVVGQGFNYVGDGNLQDDVHSTLEVQTQTNLCLQAVLIRVDAEVLHGILVILLCHGI